MLVIPAPPLSVGRGGGKPLRSFEQVEIATLSWIDWFNNTRLHGEIGYLPPVEFEEAYYRAAADAA